MAATDNFADQPITIIYSARNLEAVTPDDSTELANVSRALWVGGGGAITVLTATDQVILISGIAAGTLLPIQIKRVNSTNTDATLMVSLY